MMLPIAFITANVLEQKCIKHKGIYRLLLFVPCSMTFVSCIDTTVYEAAAIDGAAGIKSFFLITIPLLKPAIVLTMITSLNGSMQALDEIYTLTDGGPGNATLTVAMHLYNTAFRSSTNFGYASAMGVMLTLVIYLVCTHIRHLPSF